MQQGFAEMEEVGTRRDVNKQDNRELEHHTGPLSGYLHNKELCVIVILITYFSLLK